MCANVVSQKNNVSISVADLLLGIEIHWFNVILKKISFFKSIISIKKKYDQLCKLPIQ